MVRVRNPPPVDIGAEPWTFARAPALCVRVAVAVTLDADCRLPARDDGTRRGSPRCQSERARGGAGFGQRRSANNISVLRAGSGVSVPCSSPVLRIQLWCQ